MEICLQSFRKNKKETIDKLEQKINPKTKTEKSSVVAAHKVKVLEIQDQTKNKGGSHNESRSKSRTGNPRRIKVKDSTQFTIFWDFNDKGGER